MIDVQHLRRPGDNAAKIEIRCAGEESPPSSPGEKKQRRPEAYERGRESELYGKANTKKV